jgi:hypothetical protein
MQNKLVIEILPHQYGELQKLLDRALNTWEPHTRPAWINEVESQLMEKMHVAHIQTPVENTLSARGDSPFAAIDGGAAKSASCLGQDGAHPADSYPGP